MTALAITLVACLTVLALAAFMRDAHIRQLAANAAQQSDGARVAALVERVEAVERSVEQTDGEVAKVGRAVAVLNEGRKR